jgi:Flp pilus assembly protein TadD
MSDAPTPPPQAEKSEPPAEPPVATGATDGPRGPEGFDFRTLAGMLLLIFAVFMPAISPNTSFMMEDANAILANPSVVGGGGIAEVWTSTHPMHFQPLTYASYWLDYQSWGASPRSYHAINLLLHAATCVVIWLVFRRVGVFGAIAAAMLFAVHPLNTETVSWILQRDNILGGLFFFLTCLMLLKADERRSWAWFLLAIVLFAAALLSNAFTAMLPAVVLLYCLLRGKLFKARSWIAIVPLTAMAAAVAWIALAHMQEHAVMTGEVYAAGFADRFARSGWIVTFYLKQFIWPTKLAFYYADVDVDAAAAMTYIPHACIGAALLVMLVFWKSWGRAALLGFGFFLLMLFPAMGFIDLPYFSRAVVADHFMYLPLVGLAGGLIHLGGRLLESFGLAGRSPVSGRPKIEGQVVALAAIAGCAWLTYSYTQAFQREDLLVKRSVAVEPNSFFAQRRLGDIYLQVAKGDREGIEAAVRQFEAALELREGDPQTLAALGLAQLRLGRNTEAELHIRQAVEARPDAAGYRLSLANALMAQDRLEAAAREAQAAIARTDENAPLYMPANLLYVQILTKLEQADRALETLERLLEKKPDAPDLHYMLGKLLMATGSVEEGLDHLREAGRLDPKNAKLQGEITAIEQQLSRQNRPAAQDGPMP